MAEPRLRQRGTLWAPKALVVLSCALALLAMQPVGVSTSVRSRPALQKDMGTGVAATTWETSRRTDAVAARPSVKTSWRDDTLFASAHRLHILATVEILQRLLITELQPAQRQMLSALWIGPECPAVVLIAQPQSNPGVCGKEFLRGAIPEAEKAFAMAHCQLAPPRS